MMDEVSNSNLAAKDLICLYYNFTCSSHLYFLLCFSFKVLAVMDEVSNSNLAAKDLICLHLKEKKKKN